MIRHTVEIGFYPARLCTKREMDSINHNGAVKHGRFGAGEEDDVRVHMD